MGKSISFAKTFRLNVSLRDVTILQANFLGQKGKGVGPCHRRIWWIMNLGINTVAIVSTLSSWFSFPHTPHTTHHNYITFALIAKLTVTFLYSSWFNSNFLFCSFLLLLPLCLLLLLYHFQTKMLLRQAPPPKDPRPPTPMLPVVILEITLCECNFNDYLWLCHRSRPSERTIVDGPSHLANQDYPTDVWVYVQWSSLSMLPILAITKAVQEGVALVALITSCECMFNNHLWLYHWSQLSRKPKWGRGSR